MKTKVLIATFTVLALAWTLIYQTLLALMLKVVFFTSIAATGLLWYKFKNKITISSHEERSMSCQTKMMNAVRQHRN